MSSCVPDEITAIRAELRLGRTAPALIAERVDRLLERFPDSPDLWVLRGEASMLAGDTGLARSAFERALALDPGHRGAEERLRECGPPGKP